MGDSKIKSQIYLMYDCNIIAMILMSTDISVAEQPMEIKIIGYEVVEKIARTCASSGRVLVPRSWVGKRVRIIRVDP